jgi:hypothetical protein
MPEIKVLQTIETTVNSVRAVIIISKADKVTSLFHCLRLIISMWAVVFPSYF